MGKSLTADNTAAEAEADDDGNRCQLHADWCSKRFTLRCLIVLILSAGVFISALFCLPFFNVSRSRTPGFSAPVVASFYLPKSLPFLSLNKNKLEYDIFGELAIPNNTVKIVSMKSSNLLRNSTRVIFSIVPVPNHPVVKINPVILSVLRSSMIELLLQHTNLSLTPSLFGHPSSFEILKFPGGITITPVQSAPIWQITQNLFNFTLHNSIYQVRKNLNELKGQLKYGLNLKHFENVYVQMTNLKGSTLDPPVIIEASVLSDVGSRSLLPPRLKQLAQTLSRSPAKKNLGLNHTVFGKVNQVVLSSYLNRSIVLSEAPAPSPYPQSATPPPPPPPPPPVSSHHPRPFHPPCSLQPPSSPPSSPPLSPPNASSSGTPTPSSPKRTPGPNNSQQPHDLSSPPPTNHTSSLKHGRKGDGKASMSPFSSEGPIAQPPSTYSNSSDSTYLNHLRRTVLLWVLLAFHLLEDE